MEAAYLLGVDEKTITAWQRRTIDPLPVQKADRRGQPNQYDPRLLVEWKIRQELAKVTGTDSGEILDLEQERARLAKEQRIAQELKNAQIRRETAPIEIISFMLSKIGAQVSAILDTIPGKVKRRVPKLSSAEIEIIKREIVKAQNVAAKVTVNVDDYQPDA
jgi:phage terminase Nu1 subunit (DNA packaging protein)